VDERHRAAGPRILRGHQRKARTQRQPHAMPHGHADARPPGEKSGVRRSFMLKTILACCAVTVAFAQAPNRDLGYTDTPMLPGLPYHVHDPARPRPPVVTAAAQVGGAPSDAIVLFDGRDLSQWQSKPWKVENGYFEVVPGTGDLATKQSFGDVQLHVEWAAPAMIRGTSQNRG